MCVIYRVYKCGNLEFVMPCIIARVYNILYLSEAILQKVYWNCMVVITRQ